MRQGIRTRAVFFTGHRNTDSNGMSRVHSVMQSQKLLE